MRKEIELGDVLIANNPCIMGYNNAATLTVGEQYIVESVSEGKFDVVDDDGDLLGDSEGLSLGEIDIDSLGELEGLSEALRELDGLSEGDSLDFSEGETLDDGLREDDSLVEGE